jgi:hypothetical protein
MVSRHLQRRRVIAETVSLPGVTHLMERQRNRQNQDRHKVSPADPAAQMLIMFMAIKGIDFAPLSSIHYPPSRYRAVSAVRQDRSIIPYCREKAASADDPRHRQTDFLTIDIQVRA